MRDQPFLVCSIRTDLCIIYYIYMNNIKIYTRQYNFVILEKSSRTQDTKKSIVRLFTMSMHVWISDSKNHIYTYAHIHIQYIHTSCQDLLSGNPH